MEFDGGVGGKGRGTEVEVPDHIKINRKEEW